MGVPVKESPPRLCSVDPLVDVLPDRSIDAAVALGKAVDRERSSAPRQDQQANALASHDTDWLLSQVAPSAREYYKALSSSRLRCCQVVPATNSAAIPLQFRCEAVKILLLFVLGETGFNLLI